MNVLFIELQKLIKLKTLNDTIMQLPIDIISNIKSFLMKDNQMSSPTAKLVKSHYFQNIARRNILEKWHSLNLLRNGARGCYYIVLHPCELNHYLHEVENMRERHKLQIYYDNLKYFDEIPLM